MAFEAITIETQEQMDELFKDRVARAEKKFEGWISPEDLTGKLAAKDEEISNLTAQITDLEKEKSEFDTKLADKDKTIKQYEIGSAKTKIANELGLSYDAVDFLKGEDEDAIRKSAKTLSELLKKNKSGMPEPSSEKGTPDSKTAALKEMLAQINNR